MLRAVLPIENIRGKVGVLVGPVLSEELRVDAVELIRR
jgi:hypothetical protein